MCMLASLTWAMLLKLGVFVTELRTRIRIYSSELENQDLNTSL